MLYASSVALYGDTTRDALEASSSFWFNLVLIAGAVVALGCILEAPETLHSIREWQKERLRNGAAEAGWKVPASAVGLLLVIIGVGSETLFEGVVARKETLLRRHDLQLLSTAEVEAARAIQAAALANERAQTVGKQAESLRNDAEKAKLETARLTATVAPRRLTIYQQANLTKHIAKFKGKTVGVATYIQDPEAMLLGIQIEAALSKAGILVHDRVGTFEAMGTPLHLGVLVDTSGSEISLQEALLHALSNQTHLQVARTRVGFGAGSSMYMTPLPKGSTKEDAFIMVGEKPLAPWPAKLSTQPMR